MPEFKPQETMEIRQRLLVFWLTMMDDETLDPQQRIKSSEMVAKYALGDGQGSAKVPSIMKPSTADILRELDLEEE